jgi:outer membrane receptor for ferrienterochelin and colicins
MTARFRHVLSFLAFVLIATPTLGAQTTTLRGRVIDGSGAAVASAIVQATSGARSGNATTGADGSYSMSLEPGSYTVTARRIGFSGQRINGVEVRGATTTLDITMSALAAVLNQVVVSATPVAGGGEKVLDAPAHVGVVSTLEVEERPSLSVADHLKGQAGVDVSHGGLVQANIVARGFNNAFSGSMLVLQDNRFSSVPSLRVNVPFLSPSVNEDIERIEVLLGPAAALYGPNSANGVLHVITKSPFTSQGGTITLDAGERSVLRGSARYAGLFGDKVGYKLSGEIVRGDDWEYRDPAEPATILRPDGTITGGVANRVSTPNARDFSIDKAAGEARLDLRPRPNLEWMNTVGMTHAGNYIEITGANGAAQARNWNYLTAQSRVKWNRTFAQVFYNSSNAGNEDSLDTEGTFLLRTGTPIVDKSSVLTAQLQQAIDLGTRQSFVIGGDYIATNPETGNTINGRNEAIDNVREYGGYLHSVSRLSDKFEFVGALRLDSHSEQEDMFFSPRAALVFKPTENQNLRLTYNRAFSTPANFSFFLDLPQGRIPLNATTSYTIRALGVPESGFFYPSNSATGVGGLYMRSPFPVLAPNPTNPPAFAPQARIDAHAALMYRTLVGANQTAFVNALIAAGVTPANAPAVFGALLGAANPTPAQIGTTLRLFNPAGVGTPAGPFATVVAPTDLRAIDRLKSTLSNTYEVGYKGILADRVRLAVNGWFEQKDNFTTPAVSVTPNAFMNSTQLGAYIGGILAAEAAAGRVPPAAVAPLATGFTTTLASVPVGTIMIEQNGVAPDAGLTNRSDLIFTYRNVDEQIDLYGTDLSLDILATERITLAGTYGWISKTEFPNIASGVEMLRINAPEHKASLAARFRDEVTGWSGELRGRYTDAFRVNSGVYVGNVPVNALVDLSVTYRLPQTMIRGKGAMISLAATNLLDERVPTFIGVPSVGRLVMTRLQYNF